MKKIDKLNTDFIKDVQSGHYERNLSINLMIKAVLKINEIIEYLNDPSNQGEIGELYQVAYTPDWAKKYPMWLNKIIFWILNKGWFRGLERYL